MNILNLNWEGARYKVYSRRHSVVMLHSPPSRVACCLMPVTFLYLIQLVPRKYFKSNGILLHSDCV